MLWDKLKSVPFVAGSWLSIQPVHSSHKVFFSVSVLNQSKGWNRWTDPNSLKTPVPTVRIFMNSSDHLLNSRLNICSSQVLSKIIFIVGVWVAFGMAPIFFCHQWQSWRERNKFSNHSLLFLFIANQTFFLPFWEVPQCRVNEGFISCCPHFSVWEKNKVNSVQAPHAGWFCINNLVSVCGNGVDQQKSA